MKKCIIILTAICILLSLNGCTVQKDITASFQPTETSFSIDNYHLQITADSSFREDTGGSYDLQITNDSTYISIMAYNYIDLPVDITPLDVYAFQNEDLCSKRSAVATIEEPTEQTLPQGTLTRTLFSAEKNGVKNYYASYLIDLPDEKVFAWVLVTAMPSYLRDNQEYLHNIVCSLAPIA